MIMIRKLFLTILALLAVCSLRAQQPDLLRQLSAHPEYLDGTDYLCPADATDLTPAPEGYEAAVRKMTKRGFLVEIQETGAAGEKATEVRNLEEKKDQKTETGTEIAGQKENGAAEGKETEVR